MGRAAQVSMDNSIVRAKPWLLLSLLMLTFTQYFFKAWAAMDRIAKFLQREQRSVIEEKETPLENATSEINDESTILNVADASFRIGSFSDEKAAFEVSGVNFSLKRGEILALAGPVGGGKSTFVNGLISEVAVSPGATISMLKGGKIAYVSQTAFIMNTTLRENILFGKPFEQEWYEKVLGMCCLWPDIKLLGEAGDLTEIGERGVTLSGGECDEEGKVIRCDVETVDI